LIFRILFVDDDGQSIFPYSSLLEEEGHTVIYCETMDEAIQQYNCELFDLIVLDISIPHGTILSQHISDNNPDDKNGYVLRRNVRLIAINTPLLLFTHLDPAGEQEGRSFVAEDNRSRLLSKPDIDPEEFLSYITQFIRECSREEDREHFYKVRRYEYIMPTDPVESFVCGRFIPLRKADGAQLDDFPVFGAFWQARLEMTTQDYTLFKFVLPEDEQIQGIVGWERINSRKSSEFMYESSSRNRRGNPQREHKGVGHALITRVLQEMMRCARPTELIIHDRNYETEHWLLESVGFQWVKTTKSFTISYDAASDWLKRILC
jgi:CheY-like chemotaxis protein